MWITIFSAIVLSGVSLAADVRSIGILIQVGCLTFKPFNTNGRMHIQNETVAVQLLEKLYKVDERIRPGIYGPPTMIDVDLNIINFGSLNEIEMEFSLDMDVRTSWIDPRLAYESESDVPLHVPAKDSTNFWVPDIYFPNSKSGKRFELLLPNIAFIVYRNGTVRYITRVGIIVQCTMHLSSFPLDKQKCVLKISTYSYDANEILLRWKDDQIEIKLDQLNLPQTKLYKVKISKKCQEVYKTGNYSCIMASFYFQRRFGFFLLQTYIPSILIVMLSWVAFWINKNSEPARITLGVTTVLTMTTQLTSSRSNTMRVSYPKAIDVWYSTCMIFVFGALLEYALVNISIRTEKKKEQNGQIEEYEAIEMEDISPRKQKPIRQLSVSVGVWAQKMARWKKSLRSKDIDHWSRIIFPFSFFIFNCIYWSVYGTKEAIKSKNN